MVTDVGATPVVQTSGGGFGDGFGGCGWWGFLILAMMFWGGGGFFGGGRGMAGPAVAGADSAAAAEAVKSAVWQAQDLGQTQDQVRGISYGLSDLGYATQQGLFNVQNAINGAEMATQQGFFGLQNAINGVGMNIVQSANHNGSKIDAAAYALNTGILNSKYETAQEVAAAAAGVTGAINGLAWQMADRINGINGQLCCIGNKIAETNFANAMNTNAINANVTAQTQRVIDTVNCNEKARLNQELADSKMALMEARIVASQKPIAPVPAYTVQSPYASASSAS